MRKILSVLSILFLLTSNSWATVGWRISIPATSENPQAISPDVIENNTALDLMLQNYRDGQLTISLISTSEIDIGPGGVMLSNSGGSIRLMVANTTLTAVSSTMIDTGTISASSTYYLYAYASSTTATTFSVIFSASSSSPTGITYYKRLGSFTTDASENFVGTVNDVYPFTLGTWVKSSSPSTPVQASTNGFFSCYSVSGAGSCITDSSSSPSVVRNAGSGGCSTMVRKNDYYDESGIVSGNCYFISIGS